MARKATNGVIAERVKALKGMILAGSSNSVCVGFAAEEWGCFLQNRVSLAEKGLGVDPRRR